MSVVVNLIVAGGGDGTSGAIVITAARKTAGGYGGTGFTNGGYDSSGAGGVDGLDFSDVDNSMYFVLRSIGVN